MLTAQQPLERIFLLMCLCLLWFVWADYVYHAVKTCFLSGFQWARPPMGLMTLCWELSMEGALLQAVAWWSSPHPSPCWVLASTSSSPCCRSITYRLAQCCFRVLCVKMRITASFIERTLEVNLLCKAFVVKDSKLAHSLIRNSVFGWFGLACFFCVRCKKS